MKRTALILFTIIFGICARNHAAPHEDLSNVDRRSASPVPRSPAMVAAETSLRQRLPDAVVARHPLLGSPRWVAAREGFLTGPDGEGGAVTEAFRARQRNDDPHRVVKAFVEEHSALFGHDSSALAAASVRRDYVTAHSGMRTTVWQQEHAGIDVFEAVFQGHVTRHGELINVASQFVPDAKPRVNNGARQSAREAIRSACTNLGEAFIPLSAITADHEPIGATQRQRFHSPALKDEAEAQLVWLPISAHELRLCWDVILTPRSSRAMFRVLVDADTGEVWLRRNLTSDISDASYRVFTSDSPTPFSPGYSGIGNANQPAGVSRTLMTLKALDTTASPNGWINDGVNETQGNNVDAHTDLDDNNVADTPRPQGSPSRVFDFALDLTQEPTGSSYRKASVVNLFYWCNWMHDRLYQLGFTEAAGNFQVDNFGRGGLGNDRVRADAQDGGATNDAVFATPPDGSAPRMQMYLFNGSTPNHDSDFDTEIILHEYTHGLSMRLVGGGVGLSELQSGGLNEGWSDFYSLALLAQSGDALGGNYAHGAYSSIGFFKSKGDNYYFGTRRYPYSTNLTKNPLTFRDIDPTQADLAPGIPFAHWNPDTAGEVHAVGEVWCSMLWEARVNLVAKHGFLTGNELILQLVTDAMKLSPANPTFTEARDAILQADQVLTSGANKNELWAAFAKRGLGPYAHAPDHSTTTGIIEDFSVPDTLRVYVPTDIQFAGALGGPFNFISTNYILSNATAVALGWSAVAQAPMTVSLSSGTLSAYAKQTVTVGINNAQANALSYGTYERFVTFSNKTTHVVQSRRFTITVDDPLKLLVYFDREYLEGPMGGPFGYIGVDLHPTVLTNESSQPMTWVALPQSLVKVTPASGTLSGLSKVQLVISGSDEAALLPVGDYTNYFIISNITTGATITRPVDLRVRNNSYLTEEFSEGDFRPLDLVGKSVTFLPNGSDEFYVTCVTPAAGFPTDPTGGTELAHDSYGFDEFAEVILTGGKKVSLFGQQTNHVWVNADGSISLNGRATGSHWDRLQVSGLGCHYNGYASLNLGATISWKQLPDRFAATWQKFVTLSDDAGAPYDSFQVELFFDGMVRITVVSGSSTGDMLTMGLSRGTGFPQDFMDSDFSARPDCSAVLPDLFVTGPKYATEGQGVLVGQGRVSVLAPLLAPLTVTLSSSDTTEITVPPSVIIPVGATSAVFNITVVDDSVLDGSRAAYIIASAPFHDTGKFQMTVHDNESTTLHMNIPLFVNEGGDASGRVWTEAAPVDNVAVLFGTSNSRALELPYLAIIPAGATSAVFQFTAKEDSFITGTRYATISATVSNWYAATNGMFILDNEPTNLTVRLPFVMSEGDGVATNAGEVFISGTLSTNLTVNLSVSGGSLFEMVALGPVTIPAGKTNASFDIFVLDDNFIEPFELFQITASAPGFSNGASGTFVIDNDGPPEALNPFPPHLAEDVPLDTDISWSKSEGELLVNGGFEDATLSGWTTFDSGGGSWLSVNSTYNPPGPVGSQTPFAGARFALAQQFGNGRHELWQEVTIPEGVSNVVLRWSDRLANFAPQWASNQQFRVEVRDTANHVLATPFSAQPGDALTSDWTNRSASLNHYKGQTIRIAFIETDELGALSVSLDSVSVFAAPPASTSWLVYLAVNPIPDGTGFLGSTTNTFWTLPTLPTNTTFYWYVKSVRAGATNMGPVWQFTTTDTTNRPPSLTMRYPGNLAIITSPANVTCSLNSLSDDGVVAKVEFWADGVKIGEDVTAPQSYNWINPPMGVHVLWAVAQDTLGARGTSAVQHISVVPANGMLQTLVPFGSTWKYHDLGANLGTSWRSNSYSDRYWLTGRGQFGYGEADEATLVRFGNDPQSKYVTTYFRHSFTPPADVQSFQLRVLRDDGVAVYVDGREVLRDNLASNAAYNALATDDITLVDESALVSTNFSPANPGPRGPSLIAAEVHQSTPSSVDLSFDLELAAVVNPPPSVALTAPANGSLCTTPTNITLSAIAFDAYGAVTNVGFVVDGLSLGSRSAAPYTLTWSNAPVGTHTLQAVATDNLGATNVSADITILVVPSQPILGIAYGVNRIFLTWPESSPGFHIETTTNLAPPIAWETPVEAPFLQNGLYQLAIPLEVSEPQRYFRLVAP
jgi:hypothetical protein